MKNLTALIALALLGVGSAQADEAYQVSNIVGNWETFEQPFANNGAAQITYDAQKKVVNVKYCDAFTLSTQNLCSQTMNWVESGTYSADVDGFKVTVVGSGANTGYMMHVDTTKKDSYVRTWGNQKIEYSRQ